MNLSSHLSSRRRSFFTLVAIFGVLLLGGALYSRLRAQEGRETTTIAPGVTLTAVVSNTPKGPLRYWLVKADRAAAKMEIEIADAREVTKKRSVRDLAAQAGALVAINGGFFAYGGAPVGAVKVEGRWQRMPWKSRTALMMNQDRAQIGALKGECEVIFQLAEAPIIEKVALNSWLLPGTHNETRDGFAVLTPQFATKYKMGSEESGIAVIGNRVAARELKGEVAIPDNGFLVVARGTSRGAFDEAQRASHLGAPVSFRTITTPSEADQFPNILGAGPLLVRDGVVQTTEVEEEFRPDVVERGPRSAVGFDAAGNSLFLIADGRQAASVGLTIPETARLFQQLGAVQAMNLDGGSSTQLVIKGELINAPSGYDPINPLRPREVLVSNALTLKMR